MKSPRDLSTLNKQTAPTTRMKDLRRNPQYLRQGVDCSNDRWLADVLVAAGFSRQATVLATQQHSSHVEYSKPMSRNKSGQAENRKSFHSCPPMHQQRRYYKQSPSVLIFLTYKRTIRAQANLVREDVGQVCCTVERQNKSSTGEAVSKRNTEPPTLPVDQTEPSYRTLNKNETSPHDVENKFTELLEQKKFVKEYRQTCLYAVHIITRQSLSG